MGRKIAAFIVANHKSMKDSEDPGRAGNELAEAAEEIIASIRERDAEGLAYALQDFIEMCNIKDKTD